MTGSPNRQTKVPMNAAVFNRCGMAQSLAQEYSDINFEFIFVADFAPCNISHGFNFGAILP